MLQDDIESRLKTFKVGHDITYKEFLKIFEEALEAVGANLNSLQPRQKGSHIVYHQEGRKSFTTVKPHGKKDVIRPKVANEWIMSAANFAK